MKQAQLGTISSLLVILFLSLGTAHANDITVTTAQDANPSLVDGECSLKEAIEAANTNLAVDSCAAGSGSGSDTIDFFIPTPAVITLVRPISVSESLTINGLGPDNLTVDADSFGRHFNILNESTIFNVSHLRLINGAAGSGGSISMQRTQFLTIDNVHFIDNVTTGGGGAIYCSNEFESGETTEINIRRSLFIGNTATGVQSGGAVRAGIGSVLTVSDSTFFDNHASYINGNGGAISVQSFPSNPSTATIQRSTFNGNSANDSGGAIVSSSNATLTIEYSTIVGNTAGADLDDSGSAGGISISGASATLTLLSSIVANNTDVATGTVRPDIFMSGGSITSNGYNLIGDNTGETSDIPAGSPNANNDLVGTTGAVLNPLLLAIADNGGPALTMAAPDPPMTVSLVVDNGNCVGELSDQRGFAATSAGAARAVDVASVSASTADGDNCDIGAYEFGAVDSSILDADFDGIATASDNCPSHFNPNQEPVCELKLEDQQFCVPVKTGATGIAVICL